MTSTQTRKARIFLVEDHAVVRQGLQMLLDDEKDLTVCGGTDSGREASTLVRELKPDLVVIDIALPDLSGLDLIRQMHEKHPSLPLLALSMHDEATYAERALRAGARGYVMKKEAMDRVLSAIRRVLDGEIYLSERMSARMLRKMVDPGETKPASPTEALSDREFEVFSLIAQSVGPTQIAQKLGVSVKTVETHREHIKEKLGLKNAAELTRFALQWQLSNS